MKQKEIRLIIIAGLLFIPFALVRLSPVINNYFIEKDNEIARLEERYERYTDLLNNAKMWNDLEIEKYNQSQELQSWVFEGNTSNIVGTNIQRELRNIVEKTGLRIRELSVAKIRKVEGWYIVDQEMSFIIEQENILAFVDALESSRPHFFITDFSITRNRRQFTGEITVTGFGKAI